MNKNLGINLIRVTEAAALGAAKYFGKGDKNIADQAAVDRMRRMFDTMDIDGVVVIGEGELDEAPMLYIGEEIGMRREGSLKVDIAVDPVDGTTCVAKGLPGAIAVVAMGPRGSLLHAPDMYMDKIAVGPKGKGIVHLDLPVKENIKRFAQASGKSIDEITVTTIDRERSQGIITECREIGCRVKLFDSGDIEAAIATCFEDTGIDMMMCIGGAPEGVISAAALKCLGGDFQGRLMPYTEEERLRCINMGQSEEKLLTMEDLAAGEDIYFAATGISDGSLIKGVKYGVGMAKTHSVVMRNSTGTIRFIEAIHKMDKKPKYAK